MTNRAGKLTIALALGCLLAAGGASAQDAPPASHACASVVQPMERLACYDRTYPPTSEARTIAEKAREDFGLSGADVPAPDAAVVPPGPDSIVATVTRAIRGDSGYIVHLDNGQVWQQTRANRLGHVSDGDQVTIKDAAFSSFLLVTPDGVPLRVKRVK